MTSNTDIQFRAAALSPARKRLLRAKLIEMAGGRPHSTGGRLVAVIVGSNGGHVDASALREFCQQRLPSYMVPQVFSEIDAMPKTPAGKIDRRALQNRNWTAEPGDHRESLAPMTPIEETLAAIWADVLGADEIDVNDNFFELGGDSLLTIRILSRAAKAGMSIAPEAFFANPTVAEQARLVDTAHAASADRAPASGDLSLTPIQSWFFDHVTTDPQQWNQSLLFEFGTPARPADVARAMQEILRHHDALRSCFSFAYGRWSATIAERIEEFDLRTVDLSALDGAARQSSVLEMAAELNASIDLGAPPLLRAAYFVMEPAARDRLLIVAHHLVVDAESWRILSGDLESSLDQLSRGVAIVLPPKSTSLRSWVTRLADYADSEAAAEDRAYWAGTMPGQAIEIPLDRETGRGANVEADGKTMPFVLQRSGTDALLDAARKQLRAGVNAVLLSALARAIAEWTGKSDVALDTEGHGREALFDDVDVSRTVGWFTTVYPLVLRAPDAGTWRSPTAALRLVKQTVQSIPYSGIGFGIVKELGRNAATLGPLHAYTGARILFNYLGQVDSASGDGNLLRLVDGRCGPARSPRCERAYLVEINASIADGELRAEFSYNETVHDAATINRLGRRFIEALTELTDTATGAGPGVVVASDFPLAGMDQQELDVLSAQLDALDED